MNRRKSFRSGIAFAVLLIGSAVAFAHNGIEHVLGTVTAVSAASITVETVAHTSVTVIVDAATVFTKKDLKASVKNLKTGERVAINAKANTDKKLIALTVKWGSSVAAATHADH